MPPGASTEDRAAETVSPPVICSEAPAYEYYKNVSIIVNEIGNLTYHAALDPGRARGNISSQNDVAPDNNSVSRVCHCDSIKNDGITGVAVGISVEEVSNGVGTGVDHCHGARDTGRIDTSGAVGEVAAVAHQVKGTNGNTGCSTVCGDILENPLLSREGETDCTAVEGQVVLDDA